MMLGELTISFPIFRLSCRARFIHEPRLTPIHRAVIRMAQVTDNQAEMPFSGSSICMLFQDMYGLSGANRVLPEVLRELLELGMIQMRDSTAEPGERTRPRDIIVVDSSKAASVESDADKRRAQEAQIERFFDPVTELVVSGGEFLSALSTPSQAHIDDGQLEKAIRQDILRQELRKERGEDTRVLSLDSLIEETRWQSVTVKVLLEKGHLRLDCDSPARSSYLKGLPVNTVVSWLTPDGIVDDLPIRSAPLEGSEGSNPKLAHALNPADQEGSLFLCAGIGTRRSGTFGLRNGQVLAHLDGNAGSSEPRIEPTGHVLGGTRVYYPAGFIDERPRLLGEHTGWSLSALPCRFEGESIFLPLVDEEPGYLHQPQWTSAFQSLEYELLGAEDCELAALPAFWKPAQEFWPVALSKPYAPNNIKERMKRLGSLHDRVTALTPGTGNSADGALPADLVKGYLGYDVVTLSPEDVLSLARLLSHLQDRLDDTEKLLAIFPDAHSGDEAMKLRACFLHAGIQFDYPSPVYREAALTALLQRFPEMDWKEEGEFANGFERLLNQLAEASRHLNEAERQYGESPSASSLWDGTLIERRAAEWLGLYERLTNLYPECRAVVGRSPIGTIYHQIAAHDAGKSIQIVPDGCSAIFIFDTNALMDEGRLLEALSEEDFLVFPRVVIGELDKLKPKYSDEQRRSVRRNRIALEKMPPSRVRFVESDLDKLSRDAPRNNDARILSTAILYKDRNVTVVTGDGNFRIMCRSYGVPTMDTTAYLALKLKNGGLSR